MFLLINTAEKGQVELALFDAERLEQKKYPAENRDVLTSVDDFLSSLGTSKDNIQGVMVVVGAGGFTSTRIATTIANGFAYARAIPVMGISIDQVPEAQKLIPALLFRPRGQYVSATYSGEPNIGKIEK
ncbi:MAG: hypothetical protein UY92_C0001G0022 [Candidatus Magasanikbacteria bacterium GW2011_GWA2_56_11]|uniref:Gcp-like domain-containing protein n=1 Tax=Candidatus Magasanikbacteria bacterium GW2011_GWA2_56_11 TaxID=1619044 RepID=A0A0G1YHV0_9BACT|nr:MAG: hypothetical protein UY92_C0001G0022 [Candidatus Magasanikbacteria bacterium GW2011_GWA2_56_11]